MKCPAARSCILPSADEMAYDGPRGHVHAQRAHPALRRTGVYGYWYSSERLALQTLVEEPQKNVRSTVRVKLYKGNIMVAGRKSPVSLYNPHIATKEADPIKAKNQDDATAFHPAQRAAVESGGEGKGKE
jgi:argininosuccinate synthase